jgi:hypothetical protein
LGIAIFKLEGENTVSSVCLRGDRARRYIGPRDLQSWRVIPKERLSYVIPRENFGQNLFSSFEAHICLKLCLTVSAQRGAGSCEQKVN